MVDPLSLHQLAVSPQLHNFTITESGNNVGISDGGEAVSDHDGSATQSDLDAIKGNKKKKKGKNFFFLCLSLEVAAFISQSWEPLTSLEVLKLYNCCDYINASC